MSRTTWREMEAVAIGGKQMDHVIDSLREWIRVFENNKPEDIDHKAIECIENAIKELNKYYKRGGSY